MPSITELLIQDPKGELGIGRGVRALGRTWLLAAAILLSFGLVSSIALGIFLLLLATGFLVYKTTQLVLAKSKVLHEREVSLWNGYARLVSWNPTEGVVFLKNKQIDFVDDNPHDGGGIRIVYPILGEELVLRIPLEIQTLRFLDTEVLTKEYMPLTVQGTMYWKVVDLKKFYLSVSRDLHSASDTGTHDVLRPGGIPKFEVAEQWLRSMAEEKTRTTISRIGTGLLIADQLSADLPRSLPEVTEVFASSHSSASYRTATESLADTIRDEFQAGVAQYGLDIHRVAIQEVKLPPEIYAAAVDACKSSYLPLKARAEALERKMKLQAEADVIGSEAVGLREIAGNIPALAFHDLLAPMFLEFSKRGSLPAPLPNAAR